MNARWRLLFSTTRVTPPQRLDQLPPKALLAWYLMNLSNPLTCDDRRTQQANAETMMRYIEKSLSLLISLSVLSLISSPSFARDVLTPDSPLSDGQTLVSAGGAFQLGFFSPVGNATHRYVGIWYGKVSLQTVIWVANRKKPLNGRNGILSITGNGTLIVMDENSTEVVWSATPYDAGLAVPVAQLLNTGNLVTKEAGDELPSKVEYDSFAWQSFQHPADTHVPGMKLGWNRRTGSANLTSWASAGDPSQGQYTSFLDLQGYPQLTLWNGSTKYFRTGPSNGVQNGDPQLDMVVFDATATKDEAYFMIQSKKPSDIIRITIGSTGLAQGFVWVEQNKNWSRFWYQPKDPCDAESPCGANGICDLNAPQMCGCLSGFRPKKAASWTLMQESLEGCVRKTPLYCQNMTKTTTTTTDGFTVLPDMKMPDSENVVVDRSLSLEQCKGKCLSNCSCTAYASANTSSGIGCFMWSSDLIGLRVYNQVGQDLYVRLAAADLAKLSASETSRKRNVAIVVAIASCLTVLAFITILIRIMSRRTKGTLDNKHDTLEGGGDDDLELPLLIDWATVLAATNNFSEDNMIGEGGFGIVYKGELADGQEIAVKRLSKTSLQGVHEFKNEVALISKLQHRNLVRLLGCCTEGDERLLVYEYMPCKSLDANLFGKLAVHMNWEVRNEIINGIARGLIYLHHDSQLRIIHRDLKASNILLDKDMFPKISDFGLARIFHDDLMNKTRRVVGTYGYMSPEYAMGGVFSVKSDVYGFGVLILEIISGQKNKGAFLSEPNNYLLGYAWSLWKEGRSLELVDPTLGNNLGTTHEVMRTCIKVGLLCVQEFPEDRPTMPSVVMMLVITDSKLLPEPKQPGFLARRENSCFFLDKSSEDQAECSINDVTVSLTYGR